MRTTAPRRFAPWRLSIQAYLFDGPRKDDIFRIAGRITAEYCSRPGPSGKLCRSTVPVQTWAESRRSYQVFQEYRREYKRCFAWIKAGNFKEAQFAAWHKAAKARKKACGRKIISLDAFRTWLKDS